MLLLATRNKGKLEEYKFLLKGISHKILCLDDIPTIDKDFDVEETGATYQENAILKATEYGQKANILTIADDSGIEIDKLKDQLGIHSARFAKGDFKTARSKILKLIENVSTKKRTAKFVCAITIFDPKTNKVKTFTGEAHGLITKKSMGTNGFGYDPIFYSLDLKKTFAQALDSEKNQVSHRARALAKLKKYLNEI